MVNKLGFISPTDNCIRAEIKKKMRLDHPRIHSIINMELLWSTCFIIIMQSIPSLNQPNHFVFLLSFYDIIFWQYNKNHRMIKKIKRQILFYHKMKSSLCLSFSLIKQIICISYCKHNYVQTYILFY